MNSNSLAIEEAAALLASGRLVAMPTETVYGLAGNALSDHAVAAIYEAKGRPSFNPLIVHVADIPQAQRYAVFNETALKLAQRFWPGPLTLVLPRSGNCPLSLLASAGLDSVAIRVPAHPIARALLEKSGLPLAAPSANRSGKISPTLAAHVVEELGGSVALVLDGGACEVGIESTVVNVTKEGAEILRPGVITQEELASALGRPVLLAAGGEALKSPGMLLSHYAPGKPLRLNAASVAGDEALLAYGKPLTGAMVTENLSLQADLREASANLFRMLRMLDHSAASAIAVMPVPDEGLGIAINDRLARAAHS